MEGGAERGTREAEGALRFNAPSVSQRSRAARLVAIGASQGGVDALRRIIRDLPTNFPAPLLVVLHIGAEWSILLSGRLNDGTAGLFEIKRRGGVAVVQDPATAEAPSMPKSALAHVVVDHCVALPRIADCLTQLVQEKMPTVKPDETPSKGPEVPMTRPVAQTCPECGGAMMEEVLGTPTQFRCHIGHVMTGEVLATTQLDALDRDLAAVLRFLHERECLCLKMAERSFAHGNAEAGRLWQRAAEEAKERERTARATLEKGWVRPEQSEVES